MARNRAVILRGMWIEGTEFKWSSKEAAATDFPPVRSARTNVPAGTLALVRSLLVLRCSREQNALHTLIQNQRNLDRAVIMSSLMPSEVEERKDGDRRPVRQW